MPTGKHFVRTENKPKNTGYIRVFLIGLFLVALVFGGIGFGYAKLIENRLHSENIISNAGIKATKGSGNHEYKTEKDNEPVTILLLGSDTREAGVRGNSDSMMLLRMNPQKKIAYLVSIPRDSWVDIPGHGKCKINAAYSYGGSDLEVETVEKLTGLTINHFVNIDFQGFKEVVDSLGGIDINVEKKIRDRFGGRYIKFNPGIQHLDGEQALDYVRVRHMDNDFHRAGRQQQFLGAIMDKVSGIGGVIKLPWLIDIASREVTADNGFGLSQMLTYAQAARLIGRDNINMATLTGADALAGKASIVELDQQKMSWIFNRIENDLPLTQTAKDKQNENIKVSVENGSGKPKIAKEMADKLVDLSFKVGTVGNAKKFGYNVTQIITPGDKLKLAKRVKDQIGLGQVITDDTVGDNSDVLVIVGKDFAGKIKQTLYSSGQIE